MKLNTKIITALLAGLIAISVTQQSYAAAENTDQLLIAAVKKNNIKKVGILIDAGADINAQDKDGSTTLHIATLRGHTDIVRILIATGANPNARNRNDSTALHLVASSLLRDRTNIALILIKNGADINARDDYGETALHKAARAGYTEIALALIASRADLTIQNQDGKTALNIACRLKHWHDVEPMLDAMYTMNTPETTETFDSLTRYNNSGSTENGEPTHPSIQLPNGELQPTKVHQNIKLPYDILAEITEFVTGIPSSLIMNIPQEPTYRWLQLKLGSDYYAYRNWKQARNSQLNAQNDGGGPA